MHKRESLLVLMDNVLNSKTVFHEYTSLEDIIADEKKCVSILRRVLKDKTFEVPDGIHYEIVQCRAEHSVINYALGLVFREFADLFEEIDKILINSVAEKSNNVADEIWLSLALNHDVGYFRKQILDGSTDYKKVHKYYLFKDDYSGVYEKKYNCLNNMSYQVPELYAFTYSEILEYDFMDRERRRERSDLERINHGIFGGAEFFDRMLRKFDKEKSVRESTIKMVKAIAITIAQHNMYKSDCVENDHFYPVKLWYGSDFKIGLEHPLLLLLALVDTVECVKKLGKTNNRKSFLQAKTVLKSIWIKVDRRSVEIDYSELKSRLIKKNNESLLKSYNSYIEGVKGLETWTCFKVACIGDEDALRIYI